MWIKTDTFFTYSFTGSHLNTPVSLWLINFFSVTRLVFTTVWLITYKVISCLIVHVPAPERPINLSVGLCLSAKHYTAMGTCTKVIENRMMTIAWRRHFETRLDTTYSFVLILSGHSNYFTYYLTWSRLKNTRGAVTNKLFQRQSSRLHDSLSYVVSGIVE